MKLAEIAEFLQAPLIGDGDIEIQRVASYEKAEKGEIAFLEKAESEQRGQSLLQQKIGSNLGRFLNRLFLVMNN